MDIIICGAGEVGRHSAEVLAPAGHNITVIDRDAAKLAQLEDAMDIRSLLGNATQAQTLTDAGAAGADLVIAATNIDEINILAASVAKALGAAKTMARVHHSAFFEARGLDYGRHFGIDHLVCPEHATALAIASVLRSPGALVVENFARGKIEMQALRISASAKAAGQPLRMLKLPGSARLAAIERGGEAFLPTADTVLTAGDVATLIGDAASFPKVRKLFTDEADRRLRVMIAGGSTQAVWLCRALRSTNASVRLFVDEADRARELAEKLNWVTVLHADLTDADTEVLKEERIESADAFVAVTEDDETNILTAARAKSLGASLAMVVLQRFTYAHLLRHVGVDAAFSPRQTAVTEVRRLLEQGPVRSLATLADGVAEVYEVRLVDATRGLVNQPLRSLTLPPHTLIAAVQRDGDVFVPGGEDELRERDTLIVIAPEDSKKSLRKAFAG